MIPISSPGEAMPMKQEPELTLAKSSVHDCVVEDPVATALFKEDVSVVKDLPCALNELFGISAALSAFTCRYNEMQQHLEFINKSIDDIYKLQTLKESEVVATVPETSASTSVSSDVTFLSSSDKIDGQRQQRMEFIGDSVDNTCKLQNVKESEVAASLATAVEPEGSTSVSSDAPSLSFSDQMDRQYDNGKPCKENSHEVHNVKESEGVVMVPEPNASISGPSGAPVLSSSNLEDGGSDNGETCKKASCTELENICIKMAACSLRKYIRCRLSDIEQIEQIREEAPTALKRAPNPAQLALEAIGQFYLQTRRAYKKRFTHNIYNRQACLHILEFFLLSGCTSVEPSVKIEAEITAVSWMKRLISEGGYCKASSADARGLLLLVASYGIPSHFNNEDLMELIRLSNVWEISNALQLSPFLKARISDIIQGMVEKRMVPGAVEAAYAFGLEEKFPPEPILSPFLQESKQAWKRDTFSQPSPVALIVANQKQLDAFETVAKCLEDCKISPTKLEGWSVHTEIANLEKVVSDLYRVIEEKGIRFIKGDKKCKTVRKIRRMLKRKLAVNNYSGLKAKHPRTSNGAPPQMHNTFMLSQEQMTFRITDGSASYDGGNLGHTGYSVVSSATPSALSGATGTDLQRTFTGYLPEASVGHGAWAGGGLHRTIPGNVTKDSVGHGAGAGTGGALHRTIPGNVAEASFGHATWAGGAFHRTTPGNVAETSVGHIEGAGVAFPTTTDPAAGAGVATHRTTPGNVSEASVGHAAGDGDVGGSDVWHRSGTLNHNSTSHDIKRNPTVFAGRGLFKPAPALEQGFSGQPSTTMGVGNRNSGTNLYHFADSF